MQLADVAAGPQSSAPAALTSLGALLYFTAEDGVHGRQLWSARLPTACRGDCNSDGRVAIDELVTGVAIAQGSRPASDCQSLDADGGGDVSIDEVIAAVRSAIDGCA